MTYLSKPSPKVKVPRLLKSRPRGISPALKAQVLERDGYVCQWCLVPGGALDAHHRLSRAQGGTDRLDNLVSLHRACHRFIHEHPLLVRRAGFIVGRNKA